MTNFNDLTTTTTTTSYPLEKNQPRLKHHSLQDTRNVIDHVNQAFQDNQKQLVAVRINSKDRDRSKKIHKSLRETSVSKMEEIREKRLELAKGPCLDSNNPEISLPALRELQSLLLNTSPTEYACDDLVTIAKKLGNHLTPKRIEEKSKKVQIEFIKTIGIVIELILYHHYLGNLSGITEKSKLKLYNDLEALKKLAKKENPHLRYYIKYASEGVKRLQDDSEPVKELANRIYHLSLAAATYFLDGHIILPEEIKKALFNTNLKVNIKFKWYTHVRIMQQCANVILNGDESEEYLKAIRRGEVEEYKEAAMKTLLYYIYTCEKKKPSWTFEYAAIQLLTKIALEGETENLRMLALQGGAIEIKNYLDRDTAPSIIEVPGILDAANFNKHYPTVTASFASFIPVWIDHNPVIRYVCVESLIKIANESKDYQARLKAKETLRLRLPIEKDYKVLNLLLSMNMPLTKALQDKWVLEIEDKKNTSRDSPKGISKSRSNQELSSHTKTSRASLKTLRRASEERQSPQKTREKGHPFNKRHSTDSIRESRNDTFAPKPSLQESPIEEKSEGQSSSPRGLDFPSGQGSLIANDGIFGKSQIEESIASYTRSIANQLEDSAPENLEHLANLLCHRGLCYHLNKEDNLAIIDLELAYKNDPKLNKSTFLLAKIYESMQKKEKARKWAEKTLALKPDHEEAKQLLNNLKQGVKQGKDSKG